MLKNLCPGALRYGLNYYDFQEGTLFFMGPNQVVSLEDPDETLELYGWALNTPSTSAKCLKRTPE